MGGGSLPNVTARVKRIDQGSGSFLRDNALQGPDWADSVLVEQITGAFVPIAPGAMSHLPLTAADLLKIDRTLYPDARIQLRLQIASGSGTVRWPPGNYMPNPDAQPRLEILYKRHSKKACHQP